jgi:hypothetical protein
VNGCEGVMTVYGSWVCMKGASSTCISGVCVFMKASEGSNQVCMC